MRIYPFALLLGALSVTPSFAAQDGFEDAVLDEINRARTDPQGFADDLREYRQGFEGRLVREGDDPVGRYTIEGPAAVDEAIAFLDRQAPLPPLSMNEVLASAARDHALEQGPRGTIGHASANGASPGARVKRRGGDIYVGETISYGQETPYQVVRQLIVDDGQKRRGHRALVFMASYRFAGVGCGDHARYTTMCVVDYATAIDGRPTLPAAATAP